MNTTLLGILFSYLIGLIFVGIPMLALFYEKNLDLTDEMALAVIVFYPIVIVLLLIYGTIIAIRCLLNFIKLLFKGGLF